LEGRKGQGQPIRLNPKGPNGKFCPKNGPWLRRNAKTTFWLKLKCKEEVNPKRRIIMKGFKPRTFLKNSPIFPRKN